jgi:hypothetical protein
MSPTHTDLTSINKPSNSKPTQPDFEPSMELLTWGSIDNSKLYEKSRLKPKYKHYVIEQLKSEPVGHTSLRFQLPADPAITKRLAPFIDKGLAYRQTKAYVRVKNPDGSFSRKSQTVLEVHFSWWPKKYKDRTIESDRYNELSNHLSEQEKEDSGSFLKDYEKLVVDKEHKKAIIDENIFAQNLNVIAELSRKLQFNHITPLDMAKNDLVKQLTSLCDDYSKTMGITLDLSKIFKEHGVSIEGISSTNQHEKNGYQEGDIDKFKDILFEIYGHYKNAYYNTLIPDLKAHQQAQKDRYELIGQRPKHSVSLPLTLDDNDSTKLNAMKMIAMIESIYTKKGYHFFTSNCARAARLVIEAGISGEAKEKVHASKHSKKLLKRPMIETPSSVKDFGILLRKQMDNLANDTNQDTPQYYLNLLNKIPLNQENQVLLAKSLQFLKLLDKLYSKNKVKKTKATTLSKLSYDLMINPKEFKSKFELELSSLKLKYSTSKADRELIKSLGHEMIKQVNDDKNNDNDTQPPQFYLNLLSKTKINDDNQLVLAKSLQFVKLIGELSDNNQIDIGKASTIAKLSYQLTINPDMNIKQFEKAHSSMKLRYGTPKTKRQLIQSLALDLKRLSRLRIATRLEGEATHAKAAINPRFFKEGTTRLERGNSLVATETSMINMGI